MPPGEWTLRIFTISGDLVQTIRYDDVQVNGKPQQETASDGQATWNLISRNGQDVMSGIYMFSVECGRGTSRGSSSSSAEAPRRGAPPGGGARPSGCVRVGASPSCPSARRNATSMFDLEQSIKTIGLFGVFAIVFAETGLLIGFFLPGDSLLFTAGFLASQGVFDIHSLSHGCFVAAVIGNFAGYAFGQRVGRKLFERPDSRFFKREPPVEGARVLREVRRPRARCSRASSRSCACSRRSSPASGSWTTASS